MLYETIKKLCDSRKTTIAQLERETAISNGTISKWQTAIPKIDAVAKIANFFNVPLDYLWNENTQGVSIHNSGDNNINLANTGNNNSFFADKLPLGEIEKELLNICSKLDVMKKAELLFQARDLMKRED